MATNRSHASIAAASPAGHTARIGAPQSITSNSSSSSSSIISEGRLFFFRLGMTASPSPSTPQEAGHPPPPLPSSPQGDGASRSPERGEGRQRGTGPPCFSQAFKKGMSVPQWPPLKPVARDTASGA